MERGRKVGRGNVIDLDDIFENADIETVGEKEVVPPHVEEPANPPKGLERGKREVVIQQEEDGDDEFDLSKLKNIKVLVEQEEDIIEEVVQIDNLDESITKQLAIMESMNEAYADMQEQESRINGITIVDREDEDEMEFDAEDDEDEDVNVRTVPTSTVAPKEVDEEEPDFDATTYTNSDESVKAEEDTVKVGVTSKADNVRTIKDGKGNVKKKTQARIQGNLARLRNAVNMAGAYYDTYLPKSNLTFRAYKPANSIALDNRTIQGNWVTAGRDKLRATLKEFYENGTLRCAENVSFEVFLRSVSYRDLKHINCGIASTLVDKWEMDIGLCKHVDEDGPCNVSKEPEVIVLPIKDILQKSYKTEELERLSRYDNTKTIAELQADTLFGKCEVFSVDLTDNNGERAGVMNVYTSESSIERFLSVMRAVDDYLISILVDERPDMRAIAGNLNTEELLYQVKQMLPERAEEAYSVAMIMLTIDKIEVGVAGEEKVVEFKVDDVKTYEELFELFTIIDGRIMAKIGAEDKQQELLDIASFKIKYRRKCGHVTTVSIASELVLNLPRRVLSV